MNLIYRRVNKSGVMIDNRRYMSIALLPLVGEVIGIDCSNPANFIGIFGKDKFELKALVANQ